MKVRNGLMQSKIVLSLRQENLRQLLGSFSFIENEISFSDIFCLSYNVLCEL